jgi:endo-beta-N-acetylglucosaminidase D
MRKITIIFIAVFAMTTLASGALAQGAKAETQTPAVAKAKSEKTTTAKLMKAYGTVETYEAGRSIKLKGKKKKEWTFDIARDAKIKGEVKPGSKVHVMYKKEDGRMVANSISAAAGRKAKAATK